jgi:NAD-dependent deacetylase
MHQSKAMKNIVILTGAGISAESGLGTFRDEGGLWAQHRIEDVATPEGFARDPQLVMNFYNMRRAEAAGASANAAHNALAKLQQDQRFNITLVTQNVDGLHEMGGSDPVIHMHGSLAGALCAACGHRWQSPMEMQVGETCPSCNRGAGRPDIVWFGEMPYFMEDIYDARSVCDLFVAIGTSGEVYPAAGFVQVAAEAGAHTLELNLEPSSRASAFAEARFGPATQVVPAWVDELLTGTS